MRFMVVLSQSSRIIWLQFFLNFDALRVLMPRIMLAMPNQVSSACRLHPGQLGETVGTKCFSALEVSRQLYEENNHEKIFDRCGSRHNFCWTFC